MNELSKKAQTMAIRIVLTFVVVGLLIVVGIAKAQADPIPDWMRAHKQAYVCYTYVMKNGTQHKTDEWIVTWAMATEWVPYEYIKFQGRREVVIPVPEGYKCYVWTPPKKKKK